MDVGVLCLDICVVCPRPGHPPADLIRQREMKWVEMTSHWEKTMSRRYKKVKMQCRKGIPSALRARCWPLLCGAHVCQKNSPGTYQNLAEAPGDPQWMETIGRDLHRQFPLHEMFVSPQGHGYEGGDAQGPPAPTPPGALAESPPLALRLCISEDPARPLRGRGLGRGHQRVREGCRRTGP